MEPLKVLQIVGVAFGAASIALFLAGHPSPFMSAFAIGVFLTIGLMRLFNRVSRRFGRP